MSVGADLNEHYTERGNPMMAKPLRLTLAIGLLIGFTACQDDGPVAPDDLSPQFGKTKDCDDPKWENHPDCTGGGDPDGDPTATVKLADGMGGGWVGDEFTSVTLSGVSITNDNRNELALWKGPDSEAPNIYFNFNLGPCTTSPEEPDPGVVADLMLELQDGVVTDSFHFNMAVYKRKLDPPQQSDKHKVQIRYWHSQLGMILLGFAGPETTVTQTADNVYEFSGTVRAWDKNDNATEGVVVRCETTDVVTVTVTPETS